MNVDFILKRNGPKVVTAPPHASVSEAVRILKRNRIGVIVISIDDQKILGIISERDIVRALDTHGAELMKMPVSDLMTRRVLTCDPEDSVKSVMSQMTNRRVRHLPVVSDGQLCGMISIGDVVKSRLDEVQLETNVLREAYMATH